MDKNLHLTKEMLCMTNKVTRRGKKLVIEACKL
jgi:hypothetical protein